MGSEQYEGPQYQVKKDLIIRSLELTTCSLDFVSRFVVVIGTVLSIYSLRSPPYDLATLSRCT